MRKVRREIEAVVPEAVKIVGFAKRTGLYVLNLESSEVAYISRAMRAIDDLPELASPMLVEHNERLTPSFATILIDSGEQ